MVVGSMLVGAPASAAGPLPTTTTVTASPASSSVGDPVTLTATVSVLGLPGLGVTPTGTVAFSAGATALGSVPLSSCPLTTCTASLSTSAIPGLSTSVTAAYSGDTFVAASSGSTPVSVAFLPEPTPTVSTYKTCPAGKTCTTSSIQTGPSSLKVSAASSSQTQTVTAALTNGQSLNCPGDTDADTGAALSTFDNTASDAAKSVVLKVTGAGAQVIHNNYAQNGGHFLGCFASQQSFNGYTRSGSGWTYGPAQQVVTPYGVFYEAQLGNCANNAGARPCFTALDRSALDDDGDDDDCRYFQITVNTKPGDPKYIP